MLVYMLSSIFAPRVARFTTCFNGSEKILVFKLVEVTEKHNSSVLMVQCDSNQIFKNVGDPISTVLSCNVWWVGIDNTNDNM